MGRIVRPLAYGFVGAAILIGRVRRAGRLGNAWPGCPGPDHSYSDADAGTGSANRVAGCNLCGPDDRSGFHGKARQPDCDSGERTRCGQHGYAERRVRGPINPDPRCRPAGDLAGCDRCVHDHANKYGSPAVAAGRARSPTARRTRTGFSHFRGRRLARTEVPGNGPRTQPRDETRRGLLGPRGLDPARRCDQCAGPVPRARGAR